MKISYNVTGERRKQLVTVVSQELNAPVRYLGAPSFAYEVGGYHIDKAGTVTGPDSLDLEGALHRQGFDAGEREYDAALPNMDEASRLTIEIPVEGFTPESLANLEKLIASKATLIKKAIDADALPIERTETTLQFPWFTVSDDESVASAYTHFVAALCEMARVQKRVTTKEKDIDNEKYAFRCFLLRLGFIGAEYKAERRLLLSRLSGSAAYAKGGAEG